jgi:hypothetical protein
MIQELGEDGLSGIHPSLSAIGAIEGQSRPALDPAAFNFKSKNKSYKLSRLLCQGYSERSDFSRTLLKKYIPSEMLAHQQAGENLDVCMVGEQFTNMEPLGVKKRC